MAKKSTTSVWEKATKERYASASAAKKHERKESVSERRREYGKSYKKGKK
jgi:hypothetical protein